jgi:hypothetical protein
MLNKDLKLIIQAILIQFRILLSKGLHVFSLINFCIYIFYSLYNQIDLLMMFSQLELFHVLLNDYIPDIDVLRDVTVTVSHRLTVPLGNRSTGHRSERVTVYHRSPFHRSWI